MSEKLRIGIIGTGGISNAHTSTYLKRDDVEIVALADIVPGKAEAYRDHYNLTNARCYPSHKELLENEELDAVSVCTYNRQHAEPTIMALKKGINVICEKPMAVTLEESLAMAKAEKESGKILSIGFQPRFDPNMQMIKKIVESGELGKIYYVQTGGGRRHGIPASPHGTTFIEDQTAGVGALGDIGCYSLDMVLNAIGYPKPLSVAGFKTDVLAKDVDYWRFNMTDEEARMMTEKFTVDEFAGGLVRMEGGIILDFRISWALHVDTPGDSLIIGTKGGLRIPSTDCWNGSIGGPMTIYKQVAGKSVEYKVPVIQSNVDLWERKIGSFIEAIKNGTPGPIPTWQILRNQAIIDGIVRSADAGHEISLDIPEI